MQKRSVISLISFVVMAAACVSSDPSGDTRSENTAGAKDVALTGLEKAATGLSPQVLTEGECGLFLWTRREAPEFVFFAKANTETAKFWYEKAEQALTRTGVGGDVFGQQLTEQFFTLPDGRKLELSLTPGDLLVGGQRVPEATFRVLDSEGWATLIPAAGVTVCQPMG